MPAIVCLAGPAGPEKTQILRALAQEMTARGVATSLIEEQDPTSLGAESGGDSITVGRESFSVHFNGEPPTLIQLAERFLPDSQVVLSAALTDEKRAKLEYCPDGQPALGNDPGLRGFISPQPVSGGKPCFNPSNIKGLATFIIDELTPQKEPRKARVLINGKNLPMKGFVQDIVADTIRAMVGSLRGGDKPGRMEIFLD